jgi:hypothetical protein
MTVEGVHLIGREFTITLRNVALRTASSGPQYTSPDAAPFKDAGPFPSKGIAIWDAAAYFRREVVCGNNVETGCVRNYGIKVRSSRYQC